MVPGYVEQEEDPIRTEIQDMKPKAKVRGSQDCINRARAKAEPRLGHSWANARPGLGQGYAKAMPKLGQS